MQYFQSTIRLLLIYLVLLLNLGPSLHRAEFFGLHSEPGVPSSSCSCCHHFSHGDSESDTGHVPIVHAEHDCSFCKFFDQFHVVDTTFQLAEFSSQVELLAEIRPTIPVFTVSACQARGPPAA